MFSAEQVDQLRAPLSSSVVKTREQGGRQVSYVEAYHAENEANRIFGFDAWDRETELTLIGEPRITQDRYGKDQYRVAYRAKVRITVRTPSGGVVVREGCGFGSGIDKDVDQAHESALKEAESDAEKRALKTFGNPFGQALYDKAQTDVDKTPAQPKTPAAKPKANDGAQELFRLIEMTVRAATTLDALAKVWTANMTKEHCATLGPEGVKALTKIKDELKAKLADNPFAGVN